MNLPFIERGKTRGAAGSGVEIRSLLTGVLSGRCDPHSGEDAQWTTEETTLEAEQGVWAGETERED